MIQSVPSAEKHIVDIHALTFEGRIAGRFGGLRLGVKDNGQRAMNNRKAGTAIDALERARAELETALKESADWRALRRAKSRVRRAPHEQALSGDPVYRAWRLLSRAIEEIRAGTAPEASAGRYVPQEGEGGAIRVGAQRTARRRRIGLREVLERVRSEAALDRDPDEPAGGEVGQTPAEDNVRPPATPRIALTDPEEAAVSFVVREPVAPVAADAESSPESFGQAPASGAAPAPEAADRADGSPPAGSAEADEAEVVIVPRSR